MSEKKENKEEAKTDYKARIAAMWMDMDNKQDIVTLVNLSLKDMYGDDAKKINLRKLNYYAYSSINKNRYVSFEIPKKDGSKRQIDAPCMGLRTIQRALNHVFQLVYTPHKAAMGFVPGRSVATNASLHVGQRYVYNIDLKDFFPSITSGRVFKRLQSKPFGLNENMARIITDLCCYENSEHRHVLPQGAPTSPTITNFICERLDVKLSSLAKAYGLNYSRYADDITFSGMQNMFDEEGKFCKSLHHIVEEEEHFVINTKKTRLCHTGMRQEVTGITVNEKANVSRKYVKQLRTMIHNWEVKGYDEAQSIFISKYKSTKNHNFKGVHHIENIIAGKLLYMKMVKGVVDATFKNLEERFKCLLKDRPGKDGINVPVDEENGTNTSHQLPPELSGETISKILDVWEKDGIDAAIDMYVKEKKPQADNPFKPNPDDKILGKSKILCSFTIVDKDTEQQNDTPN